MKKRWRSLICAAIVGICASAMGMPAGAQAGASVCIPVTVTLSGGSPSGAETYRVQLTAEESGNPMPAGSQAGTYTMSLSGAETKNLVISCDRVGTYRYTISQIAGKNRKCSYDARVYTLIVQVSNRPQGGLEATAVLYRTGQTEKTDAVRFENSCASDGKGPKAVSAPKTGDGAATWLDLALLGGSLGMLALLGLTRKKDA